MKPLYRILFCVLCLLPGISGAAPVATTAGSNLTAYNPNTMGSINNNQWNTMLNSRSGTESAPVADFGNCNALILRCAQPKCATGGCTSMDVTMPIVNGCVMDNATCKQYGNDLVQSIAAQIVANSNAKAAATAQQQQAAAAAQTSQQMAQMQQQMNMQMQQMQQQMQAQNAATAAQLQAALEEQKQLAAQQQQAQQQQAAATAQNSGTSSNGLTAAQQDAANRGIDADLLVREQVAGEIMSKLENAETALKALHATMKDTFEYAGCDSNGNNCAGPKRVKVFKQKAMNFFEPYNDVLDELYDINLTEARGTIFWGDFKNKFSNNIYDSLWIRCPRFPIKYPWEYPNTWEELFSIFNENKLDIFKVISDVHFYPLLGKIKRTATICVKTNGMPFK